MSHNRRMGLLDKFFGKDGRRDSVPVSAFDDEEDAGTTRMSPRNAPRHEVVQVVLRDTMRKHGIPSDWIEPRILSVVSTTRGTGMHVMLRVRNGDDRLAAYVHAFQDSFLQELTRFDSKAQDWVFSISWQFDNKPAAGHAAMPEPGSWQGAASANGSAASTASSNASPGSSRDSGPDTVPHEEEDLAQDLEALFSICDAALNREPPKPGFEDTRPG